MDSRPYKHRIWQTVYDSDRFESEFRILARMEEPVSPLCRILEVAAVPACEEQAEENGPHTSDNRNETADSCKSNCSAMVHGRDGEEDYVSGEQHGSLFYS